MNETPNDGGPMYPFPGTAIRGRPRGASVRTWGAFELLKGLLSNPSVSWKTDNGTVLRTEMARAAVVLADATLAELEKPQ